MTLSIASSTTCRPQSKPLAKATTADERRITEQYSSILLLHLLGKQQTPLRTLFMEKVPDGSKILDKSASDFGGSVDVLRRSPGILPKYQDKVWHHLTHGTEGALVPADTTEFTYELFENTLSRLGSLYNWIEEESRGRLSDRFVPSTVDHVAALVSNDGRSPAEARGLAR